MRAPLVAVTSLALAAGAAACFEPIDGGACRSDRECPEAVCSNVGECSTVTYRLRVAWTLRGATANQPGACDGVDQLEIIVSDPSTGAEFSTRPVPCSIGSLLYDKMPWGYGSATVIAYGARGEILSRAGGSTDPTIGAITVDLRP